jgi:hypothetical protein
VSVVLRFRWPVEPTPGPAALRYGDPPGAGGGAVDVTGALAVDLTPADPGVVLVATGVIALDLIDADGARAVIAQKQGAATARPVTIAQKQMQPARHRSTLAHTTAAPLGAACRLAQQQMQRASRASGVVHQHGLPLASAAHVRHADTLRTRRALRPAHQHGTPTVTAARLPLAEALRIRPPIIARHAQALPRRCAASVRNHQAQATVTGRGVPHQHMLPLPVGWWQGTYPWPDPPPPWWAPSGPVALRFCKLADGSHALRFGPCVVVPPAAGIIPVLEFYAVLNTFTLVRADNGTPVDALDFSASLDVESWCWGWSATVPAAQMALVRSPALGDHVELIATLNGIALRLVVERIGRDRRFGSSALKVSGRGRAAWLADPHSPILTRYNTTLRTAQQLLADALTTNGVPIGWAIDWRIPDWSVPAGAWSHTGTYIDAATRISEAGGGYVQAHNTDQTLLILPRYPSMPWDWPAATPDIQIPEDACEVEGIEWQDKPAYNAVWISGQESGRRDRIKRAGTAADRPAPSIVDPLATAPEMTRARGGAILGDTGRQAHITLRLPVLPETGIIKPGNLVRYTESGNTHLGMSRAVTVDVGFPEMWQTIKLETHELEPI